MAVTIFGFAHRRFPDSVNTVSSGSDVGGLLCFQVLAAVTATAWFHGDFIYLLGYCFPFRLLMILVRVSVLPCYLLFSGAQSRFKGLDVFLLSCVM